MINNLISGVTRRLKGSFKNTKIYIDNVKSNLSTPCFIVKLLPHTHTRLANDRYYGKYTVVISYITDDENYSREVYEILSELNYILEFIEVEGDLIRGREMTHNITDDVLHFYVSYSILTRLDHSEYLMDKLESNVSTKEVYND